jgi:hypothetical protein
MSTLEATHQRNPRHARFHTRLLALGAPIAIAAVSVIFALTSARHTANPHAAVSAAHAQASPPPVAGPSASPVAYFRDPTTHTLLRTRPARQDSAPTLAYVLRSLTPRQRRYVLGIASLTPLELWGAFGTTHTPPASGRGITSARPSTATT